MAKKRRPRRTFDEDFKKQLLDEIAGGRKLIDVAKEQGLQPSQISLWKKTLGSSSKKKRKAGAAKKATSTAAASTPAEAPATAAAKPASNYVAELERMVGNLTIENARLRSKLNGR